MVVVSGRLAARQELSDLTTREECEDTGHVGLKKFAGCKHGRSHRKHGPHMPHKTA